MRPLTVLELRHAELEPPAAYGPALAELARVDTVRVWQEPLPADPAGYDAIVTMGGSMGVGDAHRLPWIADEIAFLRRAVDADVPVWGVCLGSQFLAAALGARVVTGETPEIGVYTVALTPAGRADPVWGGLDVAEFDSVQWHFDTFDLPAGATLLATSAAYPHQLYRYGRSYGVQFHLEAGGALVTRWLGDGSGDALRSIVGDAAIDRFPTNAGTAESFTAPAAAAVMRRWLEQIAE
ncbi:MAG: type 1 glutamine amidotransferase [Gordonia sp. (in: high G+C Gram-positive bacteria)]